MSGPLGRFPERRLIVGMNSLDEFFGSRQTIPWIKTQNAAAFLRPIPDVGVGTPGPTARVAEPLRLRQIELGLLEVFDVEVDSDPIQQRSITRPERFGATEEPAVGSLRIAHAKTLFARRACCDQGRPDPA